MSNASILWIVARASRHRLANFFDVSPCETQETFVAGVYKLPAGKVLVVDGGEVVEKSYWSPGTSKMLGETDESLAEAFKTLFFRAVERNLGEERNGALLSGGMDSSAVACVASVDLKARNQLLKSFSLVYGAGDASDESMYASIVIKAMNLKDHYVECEPIDLFSLIDPMLKIVEEPFNHPSILPHLCLGRLINQGGVQNLLDGTLGDSVISYNPRFLMEIWNEKKYITCIREAVLLTRRLYGEWVSPLPLILQGVVYPAFSRMFNRIYLPRSTAASISKNLVKASYQEDLRLWSHLNCRNPFEAFSEIVAYQNTNLLAMKRKLAADCGYQVKFPFADRELIEFCIRLPVEQRIRNGFTRYILRIALKDILPPQIFSRGGKSAVGAYLEAKIAASINRSMASEIIASAEELGRHIFVDEVVSAVSRLRGPAEKRRPGDVSTVWMPLVVKRWLDAFGLAF